MWDLWVYGYVPQNLGALVHCLWVRERGWSPRITPFSVRVRVVPADQKLCRIVAGVTKYDYL